MLVLIELETLCNSVPYSAIPISKLKINCLK